VPLQYLQNLPWPTVEKLLSFSTVRIASGPAPCRASSAWMIASVALPSRRSLAAGLPALVGPGRSSTSSQIWNASQGCARPQFEIQSRRRNLGGVPRLWTTCWT